MSVSIERSLDAIADKLSGSAVDGQGSIEYSLNLIANALKTQAMLPAVTNTDNGNVLTVVAGAWAKASLPAETKEIVYVEFTYDETATAWGADKTLANISTAFSAGKAVIGYESAGGEIYQLDSIGESAAVFVKYAIAENVLTQKKFTVGAETVTYVTATVTGTTG